MIAYSLHNYLKKHKKLSLHGIGHFMLEEETARLDFSARQLYPPVSMIKFDPDSQPNNNQFFNFISRDLRVDKLTSVKLYNEEMQRIKEALVQQGFYHLAGIGTLTKEANDVIGFVHSSAAMPPLPILEVERVIRREDTHFIRVGEDERTNKHMEEYLAQPENTKRSYWWLYILIACVVVAALIVLLFYPMG